MITPQDVLAQGFLPQAALDTGEQLLAALDKEQIEVTAAFWLLEGEPEVGESAGWRLYLALPPRKGNRPFPREGAGDGEQEKR